MCLMATVRLTGRHYRNLLPFISGIKFVSVLVIALNMPQIPISLCHWLSF